MFAWFVNDSQTVTISHFLPFSSAELSIYDINILLPSLPSFPGFIGVYWSTNTVVVSVGDTREFCLREVEEEEEEDYSNSSSSNSSGKKKAMNKKKKKKGKQSSHHRFFVAQSDATEMTRECQWKYQHAVKVCDNADDAGPRMSLVYKQSLGQATEEEREWVASFLRKKEEKQERKR